MSDGINYWWKNASDSIKNSQRKRFIPAPNSKSYDPLITPSTRFKKEEDFQSKIGYIIGLTGNLSSHPENFESLHHYYNIGGIYLGVLKGEYIEKETGVMNSFFLGRGMTSIIEENKKIGLLETDGLIIPTNIISKIYQKESMSKGYGIINIKKGGDSNLQILIIDTKNISKTKNYSGVSFVAREMKGKLGYLHSELKENASKLFSITSGCVNSLDINVLPNNINFGIITTHIKETEELKKRNISVCSWDKAFEKIDPAWGGLSLGGIDGSSESIYSLTDLINTAIDTQKEIYDTKDGTIDDLIGRIIGSI